LDHRAGIYHIKVLLLDEAERDAGDPAVGVGVPGRVGEEGGGDEG